MAESADVEIILSPRVSSTEVSDIGSELTADLIDLFAWHQNEMMQTLEGAIKSNSLEDTVRFINSI